MSAEIIHNLGQEYYDISASPKNLSGAVSKSMLWSFFKSPYKFLNGTKMKPTPAMEFGTLTHCALLTPELLGEDFVISPFDSYRSSDARAWKADIEEKGKIAVKEEDLNRAVAIANSVAGSEFFPCAKLSTEVAVFADIENVRAKCMIDIVPHNGNALYDLKTTGTIESLDEIQKTIFNRGYHWQAAMYLDLWNMASGDNRNEFVFIFVETSSPYETAFVKISEAYLDLGRSGSKNGRYPGYMDAISLWKQCLREDNWPKQVEGLKTIDVPAWIK